MIRSRCWNCGRRAWPALGELDSVLADAEAMRTQTSVGPRARPPRPSLISLARVQVLWQSRRRGRHRRARRQDCAESRRSRSWRCLVAARSRADVRRRDEAIRVAERDRCRASFAETGDELQLGRALYGCLRGIPGYRTKSERAADQALALARPNRRPLGRGLGIRHPLAAERRPRDGCAGYISRSRATAPPVMCRDKPRSTTTLALAYRALGLYRHSTGWAYRAIRIRRRLHDLNSVDALTILSGNDTLTGNAASARRHFAELEAMEIAPDGTFYGVWVIGHVWLAGLIAITERDTPPPRRHWSEHICPGGVDEGRASES